MESKTRIIKIDKPSEADGDEMFVLAKDDEMMKLNSTARFLWENCNGETVNSLADKLYAEITNKDEITQEQVKSDCGDMIKYLKSKGLVRIE